MSHVNSTGRRSECNSGITCILVLHTLPTNVAPNFLCPNPPTLEELPLVVQDVLIQDIN
jgi:hypothetical protein